MTNQAQTFTLATSRPDEVIEGLRQWAKNGRSGVLFLSGHLANCATEIAQAAAVETRDDWLIAAGAGVLSEDGEFENESAAVAMTFGDSVTHIVRARPDPEFADAIGSELKRKPGSTCLLLLRADHNDDGWLRQLDQFLGLGNVFGAGTLPGMDQHSVRDGILRSGSAAALIIPSSAVSRVHSSSACRLLSPLREVTRSRGPMIHEIEGVSALDRLNEATREMSEQTLVLLAIGAQDGALSPEGRRLALRAIQGVDPSRGALMMGEEFPPGTKVAFAVRDAHGARSDLEAQLRTLRKSCAGTAPEFGIYMSCAGRGQGLYGTRDVDVRLIRSAFPNIRLIGLSSAFELARLDERMLPQVYAGVLGVFCRLS